MTTQGFDARTLEQRGVLPAFIAHNTSTLLTGLPWPLEELETLGTGMVHTRHRWHEGPSKDALGGLRRHVLVEEVVAKGSFEDAVKVPLKCVHEGAYIILCLGHGAAGRLLL